VGERRAYVLLAAVILLWAANYPLSKRGLEELGPLTNTASRALFGAPLLWAIARWLAPLGRALTRDDWRVFAVLGLTGIVGDTTLWYWGLAHTTSLNAGIIGAASPIFVALASALVLGDRLDARRIVGIALSVTAVVVTVAQGSLATLLAFSVNRGDLIILGAQMSWVAYCLYSRVAPSALPPVWALAGAYTVGAVVLVPLAAILERPAWPSAETRVGWGVVLYGIGFVTLGHVWYYAVIRAIGPTLASTLLSLLPFAVIALSWALLGETIHRYHLAGAGLVAAGVLVATRRP
jgi:drug/metabolite transporter (DMT)-like permease